MVFVLILFCVVVVVGVMAAVRMSSLCSREEEGRWEDGAEDH
jgi:hypothetical protein